MEAAGAHAPHPLDRARMILEHLVPLRHLIGVEAIHRREHGGHFLLALMHRLGDLVDRLVRGVGVGEEHHVVGLNRNLRPDLLQAGRRLQPDDVGARHVLFQRFERFRSGFDRQRPQSAHLGVDLLDLARAQREPENVGLACGEIVRALHDVACWNRLHVLLGDPGAQKLRHHHALHRLLNRKTPGNALALDVGQRLDRRVELHVAGRHDRDHRTDQPDVFLFALSRPVDRAGHELLQVGDRHHAQLRGAVVDGLVAVRLLRRDRRPQPGLFNDHLGDRRPQGIGERARRRRHDRLHLGAGTAARHPGNGGESRQSAQCHDVPPCIF
jgi:hypothetical protein